MTQNDIHDPDYAQRYSNSHKKHVDIRYRRDYWNHFFVDAVVNRMKESPTHLLEEGGGTCGIWNCLSFDQYSSVDISEPMTAAAKKIHHDKLDRNFILGDIFSDKLPSGAYSAIVANAMGIYYRPKALHLRRLYELLAPGGIMFTAIDPILNTKHFLAAPAATLIDTHIRPYPRISESSFVKMAENEGFQKWMAVDYMPAPDWKRKAIFLTKGL